jgi:hypothetical protein
MALPKIDPLETEIVGDAIKKVTDDNVKEEIIKLGQAITDKTKSGLETATKMVISNVPSMIADLTKEIESGPVNNFASAMNKLIALTEKLGINLHQYNAELAKTVDEFVGTQEKLSQKISDLNEQGIKAVIDESGKSIKILTEQEVQSKIIERNSKVEEVKELKEEITKAFKEATLNPDIKKQQDKIITANTELIKIKEQEIEQLDKTVGSQTTAGRDQFDGFSKLTELKEAFMIIPDTITEVFDTFKAVGTKVFSGFTKLFTEPGKALKEMGKNLMAVGGVFKSARVLLMLKVLAIVAAFQFFAERIDKIGDFFVGIWEKITGFFQGIVDWFKNSTFGKLLGLSKGDDEKAKPAAAGTAGDTAGETAYEVDNEKAPIRSPSSATIEDGLENQTITEMGDYNDDSQKFLNQRAYGDIDGLGTEEIDYSGVRGGTSLSQLGIKKRQVIGNQLQTDEGTGMYGNVSESLKELNAENAASPPNVINIQNNSSMSSQSSSGTTVSGYVDHEPDTSFKYVRQSATGSTEF